MPSPTTRREFLQHTALAGAGIAALSTAQGAQAQPTGKQRNMVFILIDDMRFDAMSCMGHPFLETPHLDALAANGLLFERAYVTTALCSPSRASILTSTYAHLHGVLDNNTLLPDNLTTFPKVLQENGYDTAFIGKWHMGGSSDEPRPGFDHWVSFRGQGEYYNPTLNVNGERQKVEGYTTDLLTDQAEEFLRRDRDKPFFLYLSHKAVHAYFEPAERHKGSYAGKQYPHPESMANTPENYEGKPEWVKAQRDSWHGVDGMYDKQTDFDQFTLDYTETMRAVDDSVGRMVETLRDLGQLDPTLFVFTSDNGFLFGEHGLIDKRCMYEPSIRVPLIVHCPELITKPERRKDLVTNLDFAPTFLEAAGVAIPEGFQGRSFLPLLSGPVEDWREAFLYEYFWERNFPQTPTVLGAHTGRYKFMQYHGVWDKYEIYDLENDPHEMNNLLADFMVTTEGGTLDNLIAGSAEGEIKELYRDLRKKLDELLKETGCAAEPRW
jgi:N-acetylglucosamine-6-sulfatase